MQPKQNIKGCYLWGGVGTGKSYLMSTFFQALPFTNKMRLHFHEFMRAIHRELQQLKGKADPLKIIAKKWGVNAVLCFDEFYVNDIADAMLLQNLLTALFKEGVILVVTSNLAPENLYQYGLQRERFLPCIHLLQKKLQILNVDNQIDYRRLHFKPAAVFFVPDNQQAQQDMHNAFEYYAGAEVCEYEPVTINRRLFNAIKHTAQVIWFNFAELCVKARGTEDYLAIAEQYPIICLSHIPQMTEADRNALIRFIHLIDVLYERHCLFMATSQVTVAELYQGTKGDFEFKRTQSRLMEMQSQVYLDKWEQRYEQFQKNHHSACE
jgi:cell division protein ZapE